jgi:hypothetical protein
MNEYIPFGDEWKKEVMKLRKADIVEMLAKALQAQQQPAPCVSADVQRGYFVTPKAEE